MRPPVDFALNSLTTPDATLAEFADAAASAGFRHVECSAGVLDRPASQTREVLEYAGLDVIAVSPSDAVLDWHWRWDAQLESVFTEELDRARALGADYYVLPFMRDSGDADSVRSGLKRGVPLARDRGMTLAVEPIGHFDVVRRAEQLAPLLREQDREVVSLLLDSFHFFRAGHDLDDLELYAGLRVAGIQLSNLNHRPRDEALGYRDRTFPLDGPWPVRSFARRASTLFPDAPLIVEVIGDVARATPTRTAAQMAYTQLVDITGDHDLEAPID